MVLTDKVSDGLERLLLAHDEANRLLSTVTHELGIANTTLLPLLVPPTEQLGSNLHDALEILLTSLGLNGWDINLKKQGALLVLSLDFLFVVSNEKASEINF